MKIPRKIHLIMRVGVEWGNAVEVWYDKKRADTRCAEMNKNRDNTDVFESLSTYEVVTMQVQDCRALQEKTAVKRLSATIEN